MPKKPNDFKLDYKQAVIDVDKIKRSPFQVRKFFDVDKKKELAGNIQRDGVIQPIVVRFKNGHPEIIAGGRRLQAIQEFTKIKSVPARVVEASDIRARRIAAAENFQREDLTAIEEVEAIVKLVDAELIEDKQYASMGKNPADRVKILFGKLHSIICNRRRGSKVSEEAELLYGKFTIQVDKIFENLPKSLEWRSFFLNDLPILMDISEEVREASDQNGLNRAQTRALKKLKDVSPKEFQRVTIKVEASSKTTIKTDGKKSAKIELKDLSGREIDGLAEKAAKKECLTELNRPRVSPSFKQGPAVLMMSRMGILLEGIAARLKVNRKTVKKYSETTTIPMAYPDYQKRNIWNFWRLFLRSHTITPKRARRWRLSMPTGVISKAPLPRTRPG